MSIGPILGQKKTKFEVLDKIDFGISDENSINIFIDVKSVIGQLFRDENINFTEHLKNSERLLVSSELINIAAHYRYYFFNRYNVYSNIVLFHSHQISSRCRDIIPEYKTDYEHRHCSDEFVEVRRYVETNIGIVEEILKRVPHVYFVNTKDVEPNAVPLFLMYKDFFKGNKTFIFSNEENNLQYLNFGASVFQIKGDKSVLIDSDSRNALKVLTKDNKICKEINFDSELILPILSIAGNKKLDISGIPNYGFIKAIKYLKKLVEDKNFVISEAYRTNSFIESISKEKLSDEDIETIKRNMSVFSVLENAKQMTESQRISIIQQIEDIPDIEAVYDANELHFNRKGSSINVNYLFAGEDIS
jgi:hypothetical protein